MFATSVAAQSKVGTLADVNGTVQITRAKDGTIDEPVKKGKRIRKGSVYGGDLIETKAGATARILFTDGTKVDVSPGTRLTVDEVDYSALVAAGKKDKPIGRIVKILVGEIISDIVAEAEQTIGKLKGIAGA